MTCGVTLYQEKISALAVSEILSKKEFYDFEAKYTPGFLEVVTPAEIDIELEKKIKEYSELIYKRLGCKGVVENGLYCYTGWNSLFFRDQYHSGSDSGKFNSTAIEI